jgi:hypothetical protein
MQLVAKKQMVFVLVYRVYIVSTDNIFMCLYKSVV